MVGIWSLLYDQLLIINCPQNAGMLSIIRTVILLRVRRPGQKRLSVKNDF